MKNCDTAQSGKAATKGARTALSASPPLPDATRGQGCPRSEIRRALRRNAELLIDFKSGLRDQRSFAAFGRFAALTFSLVLCLLVAGCQTVRSLRDAQDTFNRAAAAENALRADLNRPLDGGGADTMIGLGAVRSGYGSALLILNRITSESANKLRNDQLLGDALTLKALCEWRLGQFSNAVATAQSAQSAAADQLFPRDRALLRALPGLLKTDQAYQKIMDRRPLTEIEQLLVSGNGAVTDVQAAREVVDRDHPVQIFLLQAQLAAYRNFTVAEFRLNNNATVPVDHPARTNANTQLKELDRMCKATGVGPTLVNYWQKLCALDFP